jgi:hypothetical protein
MNRKSNAAESARERFHSTLTPDGEWVGKASANALLPSDAECHGKNIRMSVVA